MAGRCLFIVCFSEIIWQNIYIHTEPLLPEIISEKLCLPASSGNVTHNVNTVSKCFYITLIETRNNIA